MCLRYKPGLALALGAILSISPPFLSAQGEMILESYERIFIRSSLAVKVNVLADAAADEAAGEFYGPFCDLALRFVLNNASLFRDDPDMLSITLTALKGIETTVYTPAAETLWQVFLRFPENVIRYEILRVFPVFKTAESSGLPDASSAGSNADLSIPVRGLNEFLAEQNSCYLSGQGFDPRLLTAVFTALGDIGNASSYPALFSSMMIYSGDVEASARRALYLIDGDLSVFCTGIIINNPPEEKLEAYRLAMNREGISPEEGGIVSASALEAVLSLSATARERAADLSVLPLRFIRENNWTRALPLVLKYYNLALTAFRTNPSRGNELAAAVDCLSALKDAEAALTLALQLGLYNSRAASLSPEERDIALGIILALGKLGYKASSDSLSRAAALPYPEELREAAREALSKLQW